LERPVDLTAVAVHGGQRIQTAAELEVGLSPSVVSELAKRVASAIEAARVLPPGMPFTAGPGSAGGGQPARGRGCRRQRTTGHLGAQ
jgi:hypothetical protein